MQVCLDTGNITHQTGNSTSDSGKLDKIRAVFERMIPKDVRKGFKDFFGGAGRVISVIHSVGRFLGEVISQAENIHDIASNAISFYGALFKQAKGVIQNLSKFKVFPIISLPFNVVNLAKNIKIFAQGIFEKAYTKISDSVLDLVGNAVEITRFVSLFVSNPTFATATSFLSLINVVIHGKQLYHSVKFHQAFKEEGFKIDEYALSKRLDLDTVFLDKINIGLQNKDEEVVKAVRKRSIQQTLSHALHVTAGVISIVATAIFIAFPPLAPVVFGLWGLASLLSLADFIAGKVVEYQVKKVFQEKLT